MSKPLVTPENAANIANAMTSWLGQEIVNADEGRNAYLSDFKDRREDLFKPFDDPSNFQAQKTNAHHNRLIHWASPYKDGDLRHDDWFTARLMFASMMCISGSYRTQCFLEATDENYQKCTSCLRTLVVQ